jgi:hypothetical protein
MRSHEISQIVRSDMPDSPAAFYGSGHRRRAPQAEPVLPKPGRYPIMIQSFQRNGTANIEIHWKPGKTDFSVFPADANAHLLFTESYP